MTYVTFFISGLSLGISLAVWAFNRAESKRKPSVRGWYGDADGMRESRTDPDGVGAGGIRAGWYER